VGGAARVRFIPPSPHTHSHILKQSVFPCFLFISHTTHTPKQTHIYIYIYTHTHTNTNTNTHTHTNNMYVPELATLPTQSMISTQTPSALRYCTRRIRNNRRTLRSLLHNYLYYYPDIVYDGRGSIQHHTCPSLRCE
jgi:hypothetical protein